MTKDKKGSKKFAIFAAVLIAAALAGYFAYNSGMLKSLGITIPGFGKYEFQKGMCYTTWTKDKYASAESDESLTKLSKMGVKWISLIPNWYQDKCFSTKMFPSVNTPSDESMIHAIQKAHSLGMKVMIKPHLDVVDTSGGNWRGEIACTTEPDWKEWFASYRDFLLHYAKMAEENKAELFCIGTELTAVATIRDNMWREYVIAPLRKAYKGPLTYAANWDGEYEHVKFWDALDYVGIDAYFPLSNKNRPTLDEIKKGWEPWVKEMEEFQKKVNKPIIFPEVGYCSAEGTAITPWEEQAGAVIAEDLQSDCYRAIFEIFWNKEWFYGVYWWRWGTNMKFGGKGNRGYSPQNKMAAETTAEWYQKPDPKRDPNYFNVVETGKK